MDRGFQSKLERLRSDYADVVGRPFEFFYCPILHRDESTDLCRAHLINRAFQGSSNKWTIQRADIDNFYGSRIEGILPISDTWIHQPKRP